MMVAHHKNWKVRAAYHFEYGDVISVVVAGCGGYGNPLERDVVLVEGDVANGYVTIEGALRDYKVEIESKTGKSRRKLIPQTQPH
jgi:N-methylhydantoinase B/oxoprolinase/acetone carboxylase alpha subunit